MRISRSTAVLYWSCCCPLWAMRYGKLLRQRFCLNLLRSMLELAALNSSCTAGLCSENLEKSTRVIGTVQCCQQHVIISGGIAWGQRHCWCYRKFAINHHQPSNTKFFKLLWTPVIVWMNTVVNCALLFRNEWTVHFYLYFWSYSWSCIQFVSATFLRTWFSSIDDKKWW